MGGIGQFLSNLAALVIPGYYSLQALETRDSRDDTHYLTYWVVYAAFSVLEFWSNALLYWVPFYWIFKTVFFLYIGLPQFGGATWIYLNFLRPFSVKVLGINGASSSVSGLSSGTSSGIARDTTVSSSSCLGTSSGLASGTSTGISRGAASSGFDDTVAPSSGLGNTSGLGHSSGLDSTAPTTSASNPFSATTSSAPLHNSNDPSGTSAFTESSIPTSDFVATGSSLNDPLATAKARANEVSAGIQQGHL